MAKKMKSPMKNVGYTMKPGSRQVDSPSNFRSDSMAMKMSTKSPLMNSPMKKTFGRELLDAAGEGLKEGVKEGAKSVSGGGTLDIISAGLGLASQIVPDLVGKKKEEKPTRKLKASRSRKSRF